MLLAEVGLCSLTTACMLLASVIIGPCWWQPTGAGLGLAFVALRNRRLDGFAAFLMAVFAVGLRCPSPLVTSASCLPRIPSAPQSPD
jgi:hypothetical protein